MENSGAFWGALFFIVMIVGANIVMYGVVRSITHSRRKGTNMFEAMGNMFNPSNHKKENSMDELHQKIEELQKGKKEDSGESK